MTLKAIILGDFFVFKKKSIIHLRLLLRFLFLWHSNVDKLLKKGDTYVKISIMNYFDAFDQLNIKAEKYQAFYELLISYNQKFNLTSITDIKEVTYKHFIDSVDKVETFDKNASVIDIGTGAGFPSVPLAILREDIDFTLVESVGKKCSFIREVKERLDLKNVTILNARAEDIAKDKNYRERYDYAIARAVARINTLCEYLLPFVKVGGSAVLWKGEGYKEELEEAKNAVAVLGGKEKEIINYSLSEYGQRYLVVIEKASSTPPKYPRGQGKEKKCPL